MPGRSSSRVWRGPRTMNCENPRASARSDGALSRRRRARRWHACPRGQPRSPIGAGAPSGGSGDRVDDARSQCLPDLVFPDSLHRPHLADCRECRGTSPRANSLSPTAYSTGCSRGNPLRKHFVIGGERSRPRRAHRARVERRRGKICWVANVASRRVTWRAWAHIGYLAPPAGAGASRSSGPAPIRASRCARGRCPAARTDRDTARSPA